MEVVGGVCFVPLDLRLASGKLKEVLFCKDKCYS